MKRKHKYCEHNKVVKSYADGGKVEGAPMEGKKKVAKKAKPAMLGAGMAKKTGKTLRDRRAQQLKELDI